MKSTAKCKKCGEEIWFLPVPSRVLGKPSYVPMNLDDRTVHTKRCEANQIRKGLRRERFLAKYSPVSTSTLQPQGILQWD